MKKLILVGLVCIILSGCSLAKAVIAPFKPTQTTIPQQTEKSKNKVTCKGEYKLDEDGRMVYCSRGFYNYETSFSEKERKMTFREKIHQWIDKMWGYGLIIIVILFFVCPSALGFIFGRVIEGAYGIGKKALTQVAKAVQKVKSSSPELITALEASTDEDVKIWLTNFKQKNNIK